jgi:flagellin-like hook-associated protein FlgL
MSENNGVAAAAKIERNILKMDESFRLYEWLKSTRAEREAEGWSWAQCTTRAERELGFAVTRNNVESIISSSGGQLSLWPAVVARVNGAASYSQRLAALAERADRAEAKLGAALEELTRLTARVAALEDALTRPG